jgi:hypothetical protein
MRRQPTERYQIGPTLNGAWQVIDLATGRAAKMSLLTLNSLGRQQATELAEILNELVQAEAA